MPGQLTCASPPSVCATPAAPPRRAPRRSAPPGRTCPRPPPRRTAAAARAPSLEAGAETSTGPSRPFFVLFCKFEFIKKNIIHSTFLKQNNELTAAKAHV